MDLYYNTGGAWQCNIYSPVESSYHCHQPVAENPIPNNATSHLPSEWQRERATHLSHGSDVREEHYSASLKVLNPTNKKEFNMFTLRNLTAEDINTPGSLKEAIFEQLGDSFVSRRLDFPVGFYHKSTKIVAKQ